MGAQFVGAEHGGHMFVGTQAADGGASVELRPAFPQTEVALVGPASTVQTPLPCFRTALDSSTEGVVIGIEKDVTGVQAEVVEAAEDLVHILRDEDVCGQIRC
jgi:hypothetical protein